MIEYLHGLFEPIKSAQKKAVENKRVPFYGVSSIGNQTKFWKKVVHENSKFEVHRFLGSREFLAIKDS